MNREERERIGRMIAAATLTPKKARGHGVWRVLTRGVPGSASRRHRGLDMALF